MEVWQVIGDTMFNPGPAWRGAQEKARAHNKAIADAKPAAERLIGERNAAQLRADFAPEPQQPAQQPMQQPLLHGLVNHDRAPRRPQDWRAAMYEQGTEAMNRAVDQTNAVIGKEMDRRARTADDERDRAHELAMAQMEQESEARRDAAMLQQDQERRAFLGNLLAGAGVIPHTVRFGG